MVLQCDPIELDIGGLVVRQSCQSIRDARYPEKPRYDRLSIRRSAPAPCFTRLASTRSPSRRRVGVLCHRWTPQRLVHVDQWKQCIIEWIEGSQRHNTMTFLSNSRRHGLAQPNAVYHSHAQVRYLISHTFFKPTPNPHQEGKTHTRHYQDKHQGPTKSSTAPRDVSAMQLTG